MSNALETTRLGKRYGHTWALQDCTLALPRLGFVAQDTPLYKGFTVAELLTLGCKLNPGFDDALALGVLAGTLTRRVGPAIFLTIVLVVAIRVPVASLWRPNFEAPITQTTPIGQVNNTQSTVSTQDWIVSQGYIDAQGNKHDGLVGCTSNQTSVHCFQANGAQALFVSYQPADRFWTFQWIETGIYVGFSALALFAAFWLVRRLN